MLLVSISAFIKKPPIAKETTLNRFVSIVSDRQGLVRRVGCRSLAERLTKLAISSLVTSA